MAVKDNLNKVLERLSSVCSKNNRNLDSVTLVAISKGRSSEELEEAIRAGIINIGENKVQEALVKLSDASSHLSSVKLHMVGHLQTNKAKEAVKIFDLIHSVDSLHLALEINKQAAKINKIQDVLIEVKTSPETTKFGINPKEVFDVIKQISVCKNINIKGLMTIASLADDPEKSRPYFIKLRELLEEINSLHITPNSLHTLSMGMSDDFEVAVEEGSTMVRIGRALFDN